MAELYPIDYNTTQTKDGQHKQSKQKSQIPVSGVSLESCTEGLVGWLGCFQARESWLPDGGLSTVHPTM
jgi:hypothetical protein